MKRKVALRILGFLVLVALATPGVVWSQQGYNPPVPRVMPQPAPVTVAVKAAKMFDPKTGTYLANQVIIIRDERIQNVGPAASVQVPAGAQVIDLGQATVFPGLIDEHNHINGGPGPGLQHQMMVGQLEASRDLMAGITTIVPMGSHGARYADVELKRAIDAGYVIGPRIHPAGELIGITTPSQNATFPLGFEPFEAGEAQDGPDAFRKAVRDHAHYGADHIKISSSGASYFVNGQFIVEPSMSLEEVQAVVDEAHRRNMWTASHIHGGQALKWGLQAGIDNIQHAMGADDDDIQMFKTKNLPVTPTLMDQWVQQTGDLKRPGWNGSTTWALQAAAVKKFMAAGLVIGSGTGSNQTINGSGPIYNEECQCAHGIGAVTQIEMFVGLGYTPAQAMTQVTLTNAKIIRDDANVGSLEKGKYGDLVAFSGDPLQDIKEVVKAKFVMKGGKVMRNDLVTGVMTYRLDGNRNSDGTISR